MEQIISLDIGRSHFKGYTEFNGEKHEFICPSVIGDARELDWDKYDNPISIEVEGKNFFVGELAERESYTSIKNSSDSKTSLSALVLLSAGLNALAKEDRVKLMIGVPYDSFNRDTQNELIAKYKGKTLRIKNNITNMVKNIVIEDVNFYREADANLFAIQENIKEDKAIGIINCGFKTSEICFFDKGLKLNDSKSRTIHYGTQDALKIVQNVLSKRGVYKDLNEIDAEKVEYNDDKDMAYELMSEKIYQAIRETWLNFKDVQVYVTGGNALNLKLQDKFKMIDNPQMSTAKGLYQVGVEIFG